MSYESAMQRVSELNSLLGSSAPAIAPATSQADAAAFAQLMAEAQEREGGAGGLPGDTAGAEAQAKLAQRGGGLATMAPGGLPGAAAGGSSYMPPPVGYPMPAAGALPGTVIPGTQSNGYPAPTFPAGIPLNPGVSGVGAGQPIAWPPAGGSLGNRIVQLARGEIGVKESPAGSNDSPRIKDYRTATAGATNTPGPWCAYFVSWLTKEAGAPIGAGGNGTGYVPTLESWGKGNGKWVDGSQRPQPGDIAIFNWGGSGISDHTGIVERVAADGTVHTIEGNSSNMVARRSYPAGSVHVKGFVRPG